MKEVWKPIKNYEDLYEISNKGRVKSLEKYLYKGHHYLERIRILTKDNRGYLRVSLCKNGKQTTHKVHRLVAMAFIPNLENKSEVNHIDGNKLNNNVSNLEWCDRKYNMRHACANGLKKGQRGADNKKSVKINQYTKDGTFIKTWDCINDVARYLNVGHQNISACCRGKQYTSYGYKWRYANEK